MYKMMCMCVRTIKYFVKKYLFFNKKKYFIYIIFCKKEPYIFFYTLLNFHKSYLVFFFKLFPPLLFNLAFNFRTVSLLLAICLSFS